MEKKIQFEDFCETMRKTIQERLPEYDVKIQKILKNNRKEKVCLQILSEDAPIVPCIYLEPFYEDFLSSDATMERLTEDVLTAYENSKELRDRDFKDNLNWISDFEKCKDKLYYRLLNTNMNEELLNTIPHMAFMDLSIVFYLFLKDGAGSISSILVTNLILNMWGVTVSDLMQHSKENTPKLFPLKICSMSSMLNEFLPGNSAFPDAECASIADDFLIVTNERNVNGAAVLLYSNLMDELLEKYPELEKAVRLIILPSSIHEFLVLRSALDRMDLDGLQEMVRAVNADSSIMLREDVLSNSVCYYYPDTKTFCIAEE